jgi:purine-binding chemotaxis protein CheW
VSTVYVRAEVSGESYGFPVRYVTEVSKVGGVTVVPGAPAHLLGVLNLHGSVVAVASLAMLLGLGIGRPAKRLVVCECAGKRLALAVDDVTDVGRLTDDLIPSDAPLLEATALIDGTLVGILDAPALLDAATPLSS